MLRFASRCVLKTMQAALCCEEAFNAGNSGGTKKESEGKRSGHSPFFEAGFAQVVDESIKTVFKK